jgi:hypothetical protein
MFNGFSEKMLTEMFNALQKGEQYNYSDGNTQISINPNGIKIQYFSEPKVKKSDVKEEAVNKFLTYCDKLDDEFFVEVCDTFTGEEIEKLQEQLDTDDYQKTIDVFTTRIKEVGNTKLSEIINAYDAEIKIQEHKIESAKKRIAEIHTELDKATRKYTC